MSIHARLIVSALVLAGARWSFAQPAISTLETETLRARLIDPAALIKKCDSSLIWRSVWWDHPDNSGKSLVELAGLAVLESTRFQGVHGNATAVVGLLFFGMGSPITAFPAAVVADGPDTSVYFSCYSISAPAIEPERFTDITGDGFPELVLDCNQYLKTTFVILSFSGPKAVLEPLGYVDSASGLPAYQFFGDHVEMVQTSDSKYPVVVTFESHQANRAGPQDSTVRAVKVYYRFKDGAYEPARKVSWLLGGRDTVEVVYQHSIDR